MGIFDGNNEQGNKEPSVDRQLISLLEDHASVEVAKPLLKRWFDRNRVLFSQYNVVLPELNFLYLHEGPTLLDFLTHQISMQDVSDVLEKARSDRTPMGFNGLYSKE